MTDAATGNPIAGVQVKAYGDERFTAMTNAEGIYLMKDVPEYVNSLYLTLEGCSPLQVAVGKDAMHVDVQMYRDAFSSSYKAYTSGNRVSGTTNFGNSVEMSIDPFIQGRLNADVRAVNREIHISHNSTIVSMMHTITMNPFSMIHHTTSTIFAVMTDFCRQPALARGFSISCQAMDHPMRRSLLRYI